MIKKYKQYIKENIDYSDIDPWGEEDWDNPYEKMDLIVASTHHYSKDGHYFKIPFLICKKKIFSYGNVYSDTFYSIAILKNNQIEFNDYPRTRDIFPVYDVKSILSGHAKVAYVDYSTNPSLIKTKKLEDLCLFMGINIDKIKIIK
jgi:hypothetical protein